MAMRDSSIRALASQLLAAEKASPTLPTRHSHEALRVCEILRVSLTRFAGAHGFSSLMRRAVVLARADSPLLQSVNVGPDGALQGLQELVDHAALTAFVRKTDRRQALLAGYQVHLSKPVDPHELTEFIASVAGRTGPLE